MDTPALAITSAALGTVGTIFGMSSQEKAAKAREQALQQRMTQERIAAAESSLQRNQKINEVLAAQNAATGVSSVSAGSPQFRQISLNSFDKYIEDDRNAAMNLGWKEDAYEKEIESTRAEANAGLLSSGAGLAFQLGSAARDAGLFGGGL